MVLSPQSDQIFNFRYLGQLAALVQLRRPLLQVDGGVGLELLLQACGGGVLQAVLGQRLGYPWRGGEGDDIKIFISRAP